MNTIVMACGWTFIFVIVFLLVVAADQRYQEVYARAPEGL